jgi:hypothetical protein
LEWKNYTKFGMESNEPILSTICLIGDGMVLISKLNHPS